ncbi:hypothetical protein HDU96_010998 [Phlyctochytrium bullatum]|nr:hypothetical protein HDU96_010998 [Phlyctochytrium bullatum]
MPGDQPPQPSANEATSAGRKKTAAARPAAKKTAPGPKGKAPAKPRAAAKKVVSGRGSGFKDEDVNGEVLPMGKNHWETVALRYNAELNDSRTVDTLKTKFRKLVKMTKPTGEGECPPEVEAAKRIQIEIESRSCAVNLSDGVEGDGPRQEDRADEEENEESESEEDGEIEDDALEAVDLGEVGEGDGGEEVDDRPGPSASSSGVDVLQLLGLTGGNDEDEDMEMVVSGPRVRTQGKSSSAPVSAANSPRLPALQPLPPQTVKGKQAADGPAQPPSAASVKASVKAPVKGSGLVASGRLGMTPEALAAMGRQEILRPVKVKQEFTPLDSIGTEAKPISGTILVPDREKMVSATTMRRRTLDSTVQAVAEDIASHKNLIHKRPNATEGEPSMMEMMMAQAQIERAERQERWEREDQRRREDEQRRREEDLRRREEAERMEERRREDARRHDAIMAAQNQQNMLLICSIMSGKGRGMQPGIGSAIPGGITVAVNPTSSPTRGGTRDGKGGSGSAEDRTL